ncbi:hypothetical protein [Anaerotruncus sp. DFI.9.16]|uniref:hypothetical protein n=1 Tax=Anaerotruncus sp. DFI.9.16 TaxID=2965275 RepID=UPI00210E97C2|nr:hypothetical protein [Anaerotruncus sp. DFI.9.16]MCQ4895548.1 hypothetical protein [Anaerotruncus sp. DFI.9.16]
MDRVVTALQSIRDFYLSHALKGMELKCPPDGERIDGYSLVQPSAYIGWIPPGDVLGPDRPIVPCIVVGLDRRLSSDDDTRLELRVTAAVYDPGHQERKDNQIQYTPNLDGYVTLLNLLDRLEAATLREQVLAGRYSLASSVETRMYDEQPFPYWYGYLKFTLSDGAYPKTRYAKFLE